MARFPIRESEIKSLAQNIVTGLTDNAAIYPARRGSGVIYACDSSGARADKTKVVLTADRPPLKC